MSIQILSNNS